MENYVNSLRILKIEAKTEISPFFSKYIYQKIISENLYWYINYTINIYFLYGGVILLIFSNIIRKYAHSSFSSLVQSLLPKDTLLRTYNTVFIKFGIINMYLMNVAIIFKREVIVGDILGFNVSGTVTVVSKNNDDIQQ